MSDENQNIAPAATVAAGQQALNQPIIFSTMGRIGRLRFLAYISGLMMIYAAALRPPTLRCVFAHLAWTLASSPVLP